MEKEVILAIKNLSIKFKTREKVLTAIRNISFDIYDGETLAIVGESGSGKSVLTKTFTNMLEANGWISNGLVVYYPSQTALADSKTYFTEPINLIDFHKILLDSSLRKSIIKNNKNIVKSKANLIKKINSFKPQEIDSQLSKSYQDLVSAKQAFDFNKSNKITKKVQSLDAQITQLKAQKSWVVTKEAKANKLAEIKKEITSIENETGRFKKLSLKEKRIIKENIAVLKKYHLNQTMTNAKVQAKITAFFNKNKYHDGICYRINKLNALMFQNQKLDEFDFKNLLSEWELVKDLQLVNKVKAVKKISKLRGATIATIFQDPMTSLNPLLSVGFQISEVLIKHRGLSRTEAKKMAIELLEKVGISNAAKRYNDIPGMYSGGMRQRVVIAIALACQPKILICDEPTTALDVTIQAQILELIKALQKEFKFTIIFITHDLGVVASIADRVAVMYAGQIIEYGKVDEIFFNPKHPYTWDLLLSLPQFGSKDKELYSIPGSPPSLHAQIQGDAFAPRNKYAMKIDYLLEPPMFKISETHFAKTWLCHPKATKITRPQIVVNTSDER